MQIKNCEDINNGDVGYITSITGTQTESVIRIDYLVDKFSNFEYNDVY